MRGFFGVWCVPTGRYNSHREPAWLKSKHGGRLKFLTESAAVAEAERLNKGPMGRGARYSAREYV